MHEIYLYGTVGELFWGDAFTAAQVAEELITADGGDVTVYLNSGGGLAYEGITIYNQLKAYAGNVKVVVQGIAASAASVIAMAGDEIVMGHGTMLMIHDPAQAWAGGRGTEADHRALADALAKAANSMAGIYVAASGQSLDEVRAIMQAETWMDVEEAVRLGFATSVGAGDDTAAAPSAFDYGIYANAPDQLTAAHPRRTENLSQPALVAMIAGLPAGKRSKQMPKRNARAAQVTGQTAAEEEEIAAGEEPTSGTEEEPTSEAEDAPRSEEELTEDGDEAEAATAAQILSLASSFGCSAADASHMITARMSVSQAANYIANSQTGGTQMTGQNRRGLSRAQIMRDERETMRAGMADALVAQMGRAREVAGPARGYMQMSLVEMAAQAAGYTGSLRSASDRIAAFEAASHSTSDFPSIFENALHKRLLASYEAQQPTYQAIAGRLDFMDFREVPLVRAGDFPMLQPINENGELKHGTFGESRETAVLSSYGVVVRISRQMMINDDLGAIDRVLSNYGSRVAQFEDKTFYSFALAAKLSDNKAVFHADHKNLAAAGSALSVAAVDAGLQAMATQKSLDGDVLGLIPTILLTGPKQSLAAKRLIAQITPSTADEVNPYAGDFTHIQTPRITGNEWFLLCAPETSGGSQWVYGYLDGASGPRVRTEEPIGQQGMAMSVELDFGVGAADYRYGYKNAGA